MAGKVRNKRHFYIVRLRKDDTIVATGTSKECVRALGFKSVKTFYSVLSKNRSGQRHRYEIDIMPNDEEQGEQEC